MLATDKEYCVEINALSSEYINTYLVTLPETGTVEGKVYISIKNELGSKYPLVRKLVKTSYGDWVGWQGIFVAKDTDCILFTEEEIHFMKVDWKVKYRGYYYTELNTKYYTRYLDNLADAILAIPPKYYQGSGVEIIDNAPYDWAESRLTFD